MQLSANAAPPTKYHIDVPSFNGPLDLLLHLIDRNELDITAISLAQVTAQYLGQVEAMKHGRVDQLIDFIVVGARLVLIKSRALLPQPETIPGDEEEEDPAAALIRQLRQYKRFKEASGWLKGLEAAGRRTYLRVAPPPKLEKKLDMSGITVADLANAVAAALARAQTLEDSVAIIQPRRLTVAQQINKLRRQVQTRGRTSFGELLSLEPDRVEISITLLAVLESIKRQEIRAAQTVMFGQIEIFAGPRLGKSAE